MFQPIGAACSALANQLPQIQLLEHSSSFLHFSGDAHGNCSEPYSPPLPAQFAAHTKQLALALDA
jgi:hypothetical protein